MISRAVKSSTYALALCLAILAITPVASAASQVNLAWNPSTDNVGVTGYNILRSTVSGGPYTKIGTSLTVAFSDTQISPGTTYYYVVEAFDARGNISPRSNQVNATIPQASDTTPPTVSILTPTAGATVGGSVSISASASDNVRVAGVQFKIDGVNFGAEDVLSPYSVLWNAGQASSGSHAIEAVARDSSGNQASASVSVNVSNVSAALMVGDRVKTKSGLNVRNGAGLSRTLLGTQTISAFGTIASGPNTADGYTWWQVDYDVLPDGWSVEDYLVKDTSALNCGNGIVNIGEECDGGNLNGRTCRNLSYATGTLACSSSCLWNVSGCIGASAALTCTALGVQLDGFVQRTTSSEALLRTNEENFAAQLRTIWGTYSDRQLALVDTFESSVVSLIRNLELRAVTPTQKSAVQTFSAAVTALLENRRTALTASTTNFRNGVTAAIDARKSKIFQGLADRTTVVRSARDQWIAACTSGMYFYTARTAFLRAYSRAFVNYNYISRDAVKVYTLDFRSFYTGKLAADLAAMTAYRDGYTQAFNVFRVQYYAL